MERQLVERELTSEGPRRTRVKPGGRRPARSVTINLAESPLVWLHARGHLSDRLLDAGEALRRDYETAQLSPSITMRWDPVRVKGSAPALRCRDQGGRARAGGHPLASGLCGGGLARSGEDLGLARAQRQTGAADRAREGRGILPHHLSLWRTISRSCGKMSAANHGCLAMNRRERQAGCGR